MSESKHYSTISSPKTAKGTLLAAGIVGGTLLITCGLLFTYKRAQSHLPLTTSINGIAVGGQNIEEAKTTLKNQLPSPPEHTLILKVDDISVSSNSDDLAVKYESDHFIDELMKPSEQKRTRWRVYDTIARFFKKQDLTIPISYNSEKIDQLITELKQKTDTKNVEPALLLKQSGAPATLSVETGKLGREVPAQTTKELVLSSIQTGMYEIVAPVASVGAQLTEVEAAAAPERGKKYVGKTLTFTREGLPITVSDKELLSFLRLPSGIKEDLVNEKLEEWEKIINRPPQDPVFEYNKETLDVTKFVPPKNGLTLHQDATKQAVFDVLMEIEKAEDPKKTAFERPLPLAELPSEHPLAETNDLGITERIGYGESYYAHSIPNRIHNVAITTQRITDTIVAPGAEFSFNKTIGDVSAATGYKSAYVIMQGKTVLGDGGGVCQVSTTVFRAVLNAGLKVTRRLPHSYRVSYYELNSKPGVDATVYSGETDFRFVNDTDKHILLHATADSKNLYMNVEIYGTSDGRTTEIVDHKTWNFRPAPASVFIPDPSLPPGKKVQVDWATPGINASFKNIVKDKDGNVFREDTYVSNYRPWSAKYLVGP